MIHRSHLARSRTLVPRSFTDSTIRTCRDRPVTSALPEVAIRDPPPRKGDIAGVEGHFALFVRALWRLPIVRRLVAVYPWSVTLPAMAPGDPVRVHSVGFAEHSRRAPRLGLRAGRSLR